MAHFSIYWLAHYSELANNIAEEYLTEDIDKQWMWAKGLRFGGHERVRNETVPKPFWVDPKGIVYYYEDLKRLKKKKENVISDDDAPPRDNDWERYVKDVANPMPVLNSYNFVTDSKATKNINNKKSKHKKPEYEQLPAKVDNFMPNQIQRTIDANKWDSEDYEPVGEIVVPIEQAAAMRAAMESMSDEAYEAWLNALEEDAVRTNRPFDREKFRARKLRITRPQRTVTKRMLPLGKTYEKLSFVIDRGTYVYHIGKLMTTYIDTLFAYERRRSDEQMNKAEAEFEKAWSDVKQDIAEIVIAALGYGIAEAIALYQTVVSITENDPRKIQDLINVLRQQLEYARQSNDDYAETRLLKEIIRLEQIKRKLIARGK